MTSLLFLAGLWAQAADPSESTKPAGEPVKDSNVQAPLAAHRHINRLLQLEDRITRALKGIAPDADSSPIAPGSQVIIQRPQPAKSPLNDSMDKKNWMLMTPEDFTQQEGSTDLRKLLKEGGMSKDQKLTPEAQLYMDFLRGSSGTRGLVDSANARDMQDIGLPGFRDRDKSTPSDVSRSEDSLRTILQESRSDPAFSSSSLREGGLVDMFKAPEDVFDRHKQDTYVDGYRQFMTPVQANNFASSALGAAATDPMRRVGGSSSMDLPSHSLANNGLLGPQFGNINPVYSPKGPVDANEQVLNEWNKFYKPPDPNPARSLAPPRPNFDAPRRKF